MSITLRRPGRARATSGRALVLVAGLLSGLAPIAAPVSTLAGAPTDAPAGGLTPTIQYQEAMAHAGDRIPFSAGGRVTVPFRPRADDAWLVDGRAPRALPVGRMSGLAIREGAPPPKSVPPLVTPTPTPTVPPVAPSAAPSDDPSASPGSATASPSATPAPSDTPFPSASPDLLPVDAPAVDPADVIAAEPASWSFASTDPTLTPDAAVSSGGLRREIFGFLPYWELSDSSTRLDWQKLSTVAFFGVGASSTGNLVKKNTDGTTTVGWSGWTSSKLTSVINAAHTNHTRVVLTVQSFAWTSNQLANQKALLGSSTARLNLAKQVAAAIRDRGADGVNLDFEPIASGYAEEFTALVRTMRAELNKVAAGYQLTFDTTGYIGNYPIEDATASGGADAVFVMGYDYRSSGSSPVGSIAPSGGPLYDVGDTVRAYTARIPASKVILGVPYYGRAWSTSTDTLNASNISSAKNGSSVTVLYEAARNLAITNGRRYDPVEGVAWTAYRRETCTSTYGCVTTWRQVYYEDVVSLKVKYDLVNSYALRGAGIWALGYDGTRTELYQAIADKFITDTIPPKIAGSSLSSSLVSPNGDGRLDTVTATLSATGLDKWGYVVEPIVGTTPGPAIRSGTVANTKPTFTWNGLKADGARASDGAYRITVWAADASNNRAQRQFTVTVDTVPIAMGSTVSPTTISPNGDGRADTAALRWSAAQRVTGTGRIIDATGAKVTFWTLTAGTSGLTTWTGRNSAGALVPDGKYTYRVTGLDPAGNATSRDLPVNVDRTIASVAWSNASFDPRAGQKSQLSFRLIRPATVTVAISVGSVVVRRVYTSASLAATTYRWTWDGKNGNGVTVKPGTYTVSVHATSSIGATKVSRSVTVRAH